MFKGIEKPGQFGEQPLVRVLKGAAPMKRSRQELAFAIEIDASENNLSASLEGGEVLCDPVWRNLTVSVGSQDHAVLLASFH